MAPPQLTEDEIDDLIYFSRVGDKDELVSALAEIVARTENKSTAAEIITATVDEKKSTCLHMATGNGHLDVVKYLLEQYDSRPKEERQAFLDAPNEFGNTGLHWAALGGHLEVVKVLVDAGASVALANDKNYVPLDLASFGEKHDVVDYFLEKAGGLEAANGQEGLNEDLSKVKITEGEDGEIKFSVGDTTEEKGSSSSS
ncbi:ankyrin repeat-containing domain protein [Podospora australis]|uniref:Ankyrin repeat-containing domain protein n=1 Tax=Podospora australis TaxID=1536484 RepID=A0AAN6WNM5_9PEZI|nr:ankyrin repeat-containing domain protein [Podospora australis]